MGNRKLAATISGHGHSTSKSCFDSNGISAHLRGWDSGIKIEMTLDENDNPVFELWTTGGSNNASTKYALFLTTTPTVADFRNGLNKG